MLTIQVAFYKVAILEEKAQVRSVQLRMDAVKEMKLVRAALFQ